MATRARPALGNDDAASRFVAATGRLIAASGVAGVTMTRVASEAGLSVGALYKHFPDRAALLAAWEADLWGGIIGKLGPRAAEAISVDGPFADKAFAVIHAFIDEISRAALHYRFAPGETTTTLVDAPQKAAQAQRAVELVEAALTTRREDVFPRNLRLAARLAVITCSRIPFGWAADRGHEVSSGAFQHELATMITRYLLRDPTLRAAPPVAESDLAPMRPTAGAPGPGPRRRVPAWHVRARSDARGKEPRKAPRQERSVETVSILLDATKHILVREGMGAITTTSVATRAGVSVGTVYQYFPTRDALLAACEERTLSKLLAELTGAVAEGTARIHATGPLGDRGTYTLIAPIIDVLVKDAYAHRLVAGDVNLVTRPDSRLDLSERAADFCSAALRLRGSNVFPTNTRRASMVMITTAVVLSFVWPSEHPEDVASGEFQHELTTMLTRYLVASLSREPGESPARP